MTHSTRSLSRPLSHGSRDGLVLNLQAGIREDYARNRTCRDSRRSGGAPGQASRSGGRPTFEPPPSNRTGGQDDRRGAPDKEMVLLLLVETGRELVGVSETVVQLLLAGILRKNR